jgi:transcriptional regulator with XRE-family HTH domain
VDFGEDARMIGRRVRQIRYSWGKSLRVVAGLVGMSKSKLSLIERGEVALDSRSDAELDSVTVPTTTGTTEQLDGMLALSRSLVAAADKRPADVDAPLEYADELAARTGEGNAYWLGFGPTNVGVWRMGVALEARDFTKAASIGEGLHPESLASAARRATYWSNYGRALARLRGRQDQAVMALRKAELVSPAYVRDPFVREVLGELLVRSRRDAVGAELRGMAYRAGLPV